MLDENWALLTIAALINENINFLGVWLQNLDILCLSVKQQDIIGSFMTSDE